MTKRHPSPQLLLASADIEFVSDGTVTFELQANEEGGKLIFRNAILARAEVNRNLDEIPPEEIDNLAATIAGCPIDLEHQANINVGVFTAGRAVDTPMGRALSVDGLIWADRYAAEAQGVRNGTHHLSVEASCAIVECSQCGKMFAARDIYCEHLKAKRKYQARRKTSGLKAVGGAVTQRPAGTSTAFDRSQLWLVASHEEKEEPPMECPRCHKVSATESDCSHCGKPMSAAVIAQELEAAMAQLATAETKLAAAEENVTTLTASVTTEQTAKSEAQVALEAAQAAAAAAETARTEAEARLTSTREMLRRQLLGARMSDADWAAKKPHLMAMTDDQFELVLGAFGTSPRAPEARGPIIPTQLRAGQTPITLGKEK